MSVRRAGIFATLVAFVRLGRPQFLMGGFVIYAVGAAAALAAGAAFDLRRYIVGQIAVTAFQLMTHYANDYFDLEADRANTTPTRWSGGSRVLPGGNLPPIVALFTAAALAAIGLAVTIFAGWQQGRPSAAVVLIAAGVLAWTYSAPPLRLCARGWGELVTAVVVTFLTPSAGAFMQANAMPRYLLLALFPLAGLQFAMLLAIEFPDRRGDQLVGKRTLVVQLGAPMAAGVYRALLIAIYGGIPLLARAGLPPLVAVAAAVAAPLALFQFRALGRGASADPSRWETLTLTAVVMLALTGAAELAAFLYLATTGAGA